MKNKPPLASPSLNLWESAIAGCAFSLNSVQCTNWLSVLVDMSDLTNAAMLEPSVPIKNTFNCQ